MVYNNWGADDGFRNSGERSFDCELLPRHADGDEAIVSGVQVLGIRSELPSIYKLVY